MEVICICMYNLISKGKGQRIKGADIRRYIEELTNFRKTPIRKQNNDKAQKETYKNQSRRKDLKSIQKEKTEYTQRNKVTSDINSNNGH